jgi:hypothetical protein
MMPIKQVTASKDGGSCTSCLQFSILFSTMLGCFEDPSSHSFPLVMQIFKTLSEIFAICTGFA